jgi:hypothetical protein
MKFSARFAANRPAPRGVLARAPPLSCGVLGGAVSRLQDAPPQQSCVSCRCAMEYLAVLPRTLKFPMQRVYRCGDCRTVLTVTVE